MKEVITINSNSTNTVSSNIGHIKQRFTNNVRLDSNKNYRVILEHLKLPYLVCNISAAQTNHTLRYSVSSSIYTITFTDGVYDSDYITSTIQAALKDNGHSEVLTTSTGEVQYIFDLEANKATGKFYIDLHTLPSTAAVDFVDLTNNGASTFYDVVGFTSSDNNITADALATNHANVGQNKSEFFLWCNIAETSYNGNTNSNILYSNTWQSQGFGFSFYPLTSEREVSGRLSCFDISQIELKFLDSDMTALTFVDTDNTEDNLTIRLAIEEEK